MEDEAGKIIKEFKSEIDCSDFHIPSYISGVDQESDEYGKVLTDETFQLAKECALVSINQTNEELNGLVKYLEGYLLPNELEHIKQTVESKYCYLKRKIENYERGDNNATNS